jgi:putative oxidoreductase
MSTLTPRVQRLNVNPPSRPTEVAAMIDTRMAPYGALLLRVTCGVLFVLHGLYLKGFVYGLANTSKFFESLGLPGWFGWVVIAYETIGGLALILGLSTRWVALFFGLHLLGVTLVAHAGNGWLFTNKGGGYEFPLFWSIVCFSLALMEGAAAPGGVASLKFNR